MVVSLLLYLVVSGEGHSANTINFRPTVVKVEVIQK